MIEYEIGDRLTRRIRFYDDKSGSAEVDLPCRVVYIHPLRRFFVVEIQFPGGRSFRTTEYFDI